MNGPIAQSVALVCHGNAFLAGTRAPFFPANSTCRYCDRVEFVALAPAPNGEMEAAPVASTPGAWFAHLAASGVTGLLLAHAPRGRPLVADRMSAGFVGGGEVWAIEALHAGGRCEVWHDRWEVWNRTAPERRIWRVTYGRVESAAAPAALHEEIAPVRDELRAALGDIHDFARRNQCGGFTDCFARALAVLGGTQGAKRGFHQDLAPVGFLGPDALAVLDACQHASVFGGMGSWNDMAFAGAESEAYDRVSERLFRAINRAIAAAANSTCRAR
ncbi:MAG TPA: hypothetical protein VIF14_15305 [Alphaproteobacteria bacterium]